ncbi:MAG: response regulator transcription factor [Sulfuricella sp.]|nr:response regulator transcription factor [Sulfuricella sp.]
MSVAECPASKGKRKIFIVDDHPIVRQGIAQLINCEKDLLVCCEAGDAEEALEALQGCTCSCCNLPQNADIAIVDMSLPGISGIELIKTLRKYYPKMPVLVISMHDEALYAERALKAGAKGYIMKQEATGKVLVAVRQILGGEIYISAKMHSKILQRIVENRVETPFSPVSCLSDKELEVLCSIGKGFRSADIAIQLNRSVKTVEAHRSGIKAKLGLKNATELIRFAVQWVESENG